jgi:hypothetical protein
MKQYLKILMHKLAGFLENGLLGIICLHEMDISPMETCHFLPTSYPGEEEARMIASVAHLKQVEDISWD